LSNLIELTLGDRLYLFQLAPLVIVADGKARRMIMGDSSSGGVNCYGCPTCMCHCYYYSDDAVAVRAKKRYWKDSARDYLNGERRFGNNRLPIFISGVTSFDSYDAVAEGTDLLQHAGCLQHAIGGYSELLFDLLNSFSTDGFLEHVASFLNRGDIESPSDLANRQKTLPTRVWRKVFARSDQLFLPVYFDLSVLSTVRDLALSFARITHHCYSNVDFRSSKSILRLHLLVFQHYFLLKDLPSGKDNIYTYHLHTILHAPLYYRFFCLRDLLSEKEEHHWRYLKDVIRIGCRIEFLIDIICQRLHFRNQQDFLSQYDALDGFEFDEVWLSLPWIMNSN
jgi:hypothetical protein